MQDSLIIALCVVGLILGLIFVLLAIRHRGSKAKLEALNRLLGGKLSYRSADITIDGRNLGYGLFKQGSGNNSSIYFMYRTSLPSTFDFEISHEKSFDIMAKGLGLTSEIQSQDTIFDKKYYLSSMQRESLQKFLESSEARKLIEEMLDSSFLRLSLDKGQLRLIASQEILSEKSSVTAEELHNLAHSFLKLAESIESFVPSPIAHSILPSHSATTINPWILTTVVAIIGLVAFIWGSTIYPGLDMGAPFFFSLYYSIPALLFTSWWLISLAKVRSDGHKILLASAIIFLFAFGFGGYGATLLYNGITDKSQSQVHRALVIEKWRRKNKNSSSYHVRLKSWRAGVDSESIEIDLSTYNKIREKSSYLNIRTSPGSLGFEWIVNYSL